MKKVLLNGAEGKMGKAITRLIETNPQWGLSVAVKRESGQKVIGDFDIVIDFSTPLVLRIVAYLKENYRSKITLADLQEQFHYSERYINQKFQKELGTTVIDYLNRCRIQNALELIRKGKLPISQIGWECGIGEYKYFNHVFKKYIGCSVREYQSTLK